MIKNYILNNPLTGFTVGKTYAVLRKKHRFLSYNARKKRASTGYCVCRETFNDSGDLIQFTERPSTKWHLPMQVFSQFRPEVEALKEASMPWADKIQRYSEKYAFTLYPAQHREAVKLLGLDSALLAAEVGSGKTLLATLFLALRTRRSDTSVVVAPQGVHPQWQEEIRRFSGRRATIVENPASLAAGINLIHVEAFRKGAAFNRPVACVVADECHFLANLSGQSQGFLDATAGVALRLGLSATPIPNRVEELFCLLGWLSNPDWTKGSQSEAFPYGIEEKARFTTDYSLTTDSASVVGVPSAERITELLKPFLVTLTKSECRSDLPPLKLRFVPCSTPASVMQSWEKCFKPGHPSNLEMDFLTATGRCSGKVEKVWGRLSQLIREGKQVLVVSVRQEPLIQLSERLAAGKVSTSTISSISSTEYAEAASMFASGGSRVMLMGLKCAQSYNFPDCSNVLIIGSDFTYGMFHQALGRCHRLTSQRPVYVEVFYYRGTNEAVALGTVLAKAAQATVVLGERDYELDPRIPNDPVIIPDVGSTLTQPQIQPLTPEALTGMYAAQQQAILNNMWARCVGQSVDHSYGNRGVENVIQGAAIGVLSGAAAQTILPW